MANINYAYMNHWKNVPYKVQPNFRDFYYEDCTNTAYYADWDKLLRYQNALGFKGIELAPWDMPDLLPLFGSPEAFKDFCAERGITVTGMFHGAHASHDPDHYDECINAGREAVDMIVRLGGTQMNTCPDQNYYGIGPLTSDQVQQVSKVMNEIGRYATDHGVQLGLHNEFFCAINLSNHRQLIESTDPKFVHYCIDTAQISIMGEDLVTFYKDYADRICAFHLKDTASPNTPDEIRFSKDPEIQDDGKRWFWELGQGVLDFPELYRQLKAHNYQGWINLETDGSPDYLASMALSRYYIDNVLAPIYK